MNFFLIQSTNIKYAEALLTLSIIMHTRTNPLYFYTGLFLQQYLSYISGITFQL